MYYQYYLLKKIKTLNHTEIRIYSEIEFRGVREENYIGQNARKSSV